MARRRRSGRGSRRSNTRGGGGGGAGAAARGGGPRRKLLINARENEESRIAIIENGRLEEYYIERQSLGSTLGNIYKARITNIEKSIGAAFVEFGHHRQGFLHVSDLCMAAVGEDARGLLAPVQEARESAHDDAVDVDSKPRGKGRGKGKKKDDDETAEDDVDAEALREELDVAEHDTSAEDEAFELLEDLDDDEDDSDDDDSEDDDDDSDDDDDDDQEEWSNDSDDEDEDSDDDEDEDEDEDSDEDSDEDDSDDDEDEDDSDEDDDRSARASADDEDDSDDDDESDGRRRGRGRGRSRRGRRGSRSSDDDSSDSDDSDSDDDDDSQTAAKEVSRGGGRRRGRRRGRRGGAGTGGSSGGNAKRSGGRREQRRLPAIEDILRKGQEIVVQVIKDGIGTKGPTLTTYLSLPGRFVVLMPGIQKRGVSRKVTDNAERERLKGVVRELECPEGLGFIVRTAGHGCTVEELQRDLDYLLRLWDQMRTRVSHHDAPVLLYQESDVVIRTLRDLYDGDGEIVIDDAATAQKAREFVGQIMPEAVEKVVEFTDQRPLFHHYAIEKEIAALLHHRVELKSGISLIMEQTEALVAIDVNSGRYKPPPGSTIDDTAFQVNSEAAVEIARQIRLRDLGGVVVIDFIDMRSEKQRKEIERLFKDRLRNDRARIKVARFSPFGILELTRQRMRPSLKRSVHQKCPYCAGTGFIPSDETSWLSVIRQIRENLSKPGAVLVVTVRPEVAEAVLNQQRALLAELEAESRKKIFIRADHRFAYEDCEIRAMVALPESDHRRA